MVLLIASIAALGLGPILYGVAGERRTALAIVDAVVVFSVGALVLMHVLPHSIEDAGWLATLPLLVGLLLPTIAERSLARVANQTHYAVMMLVLAGLAVHAVIDGIAVGSGAEHGQEVVPLAVVLHRLPAGMVVWRLLEGGRGRRVALGVLGLIALATVLGYFASGPLLAHLPTTALALFNALVAGSLLHVVVHHRHLHTHDDVHDEHDH